MAGWKDTLGRMLKHHEHPVEHRRPEKEAVLRFLQETVAPALQEVETELARHGRDAEVDIGPEQVSITVFYDDEEEFYYAVKARTYRKPSFAFPELTFKDDAKAYHRAEVYTREGSQHYGVMGYSKEQVIANFMHEYDKQLRWQKPAHGKS